MSKFFNKWTRTIHRWFALPTLILIPLAVFAKFSGSGERLFPSQVEQIQSLLMLFLAITGGYLYLIPYLAKRRRNKRKKNDYRKKTE